MEALNYFTLYNGVQMPSIGTGFSLYLTDGPKSASVSRMPTGDTIKSMVLSGIDLGYRLFDTAHCYGSEADLGEATQLVYSQKGLTRKDLFLTTKIGVFIKDTLFIDSMFYLQEEFKYKSIADIVQESVKESLEKLQTNYIDLLLLHWPTPDFMLFWRELEKLYEEKIVRAIGVCNFEVGQLEQIISACKIKPMVNQVHISHLKPQTKLFEYCQKHNILLEIWSSLLPLRMEKLGENLKIKTMCKNYRCSPAQLLLRWNQQRGCILEFPRFSGQAVKPLLLMLQV
jgi:diketogulonate reductase-like aldo/keto reductase